MLALFKQFFFFVLLITIFGCAYKVTPNIQLMKNNSDVGGLIAVLNDDDYQIKDRLKALDAIGDLKNIKAVPSLICMLDHSDTDLRAFSAMALGTIGDKRAVDPLIILLNDDHDLVRRHAMSALGKIKDMKAFGPLIKSLDDKDCLTRAMAVWALGNLGNQDAVIYIKPLLADKYWGGAWLCY